MTILSSLACVVSSTGISRPAYADIYETLQAKFKAIYGSDSYIDPDSQDGQLLAVFAKAMDDANAATVFAYNSRSPATAQGDGLSVAVKINGITRAVPTKSSVILSLGGTAGTVIDNGIVSDTAGNRWLLPEEVVIDSGGTATVTATAQNAGAIQAPIGAVNKIETPILGWNTVTNAAAAAPGAPVESDAALRKRQAVSVAKPSKTVIAGLLGDLLDLTGVTACRIYENDGNVTDANGITAHTIAVVIQGGTAADIGSAIMLKKTPGCLTQGTTSIALIDPSGNSATMRWYVPTVKRVICGITIKALTGYVSPTGDSLKAAVAAYVSALGIGKKVDLGRLYVPAQLSFAAGSETYEVDAITLAFFGNALTAADLAIAFNEMASLAVGDITLTVT